MEKSRTGEDAYGDTMEWIFLARFVAFVFFLQCLANGLVGLVHGSQAKAAVWFAGAIIVTGVAALVRPAQVAEKGTSRLRDA